jgi:hypothetical protein
VKWDRGGGGGDAPNDANDDHGGSLNDCDGLHDLLLVGLGPSPLHLAHNVRHASLVPLEGREVNRCALRGSRTGEGV